MGLNQPSGPAELGQEAAGQPREGVQGVMVKPRVWRQCGHGSRGAWGSPGATTVGGKGRREGPERKKPPRNKEENQESASAEAEPEERGS